MAFGKKKNTESVEEVFAVPQTYPENPYANVLAFRGNEKMNMKLYSSLKDAIPIIDASISKLIRLTGTFEIKCDDAEAERDINDFLKNVDVGSMSNGIGVFLNSYLNQLITYGTAVGEIVVDGDRIVSLYNADLNNVELSHGKSPLEVVVSCDSGSGTYVPVKYPGLILLSTLNPEPDSVYGNSLLKGLPFVCDILMKIYNTIGTNWERTGNIRYAVTYKPQNDGNDRAFAKQRAQQVAEQWGKVMQSSGPVKDFVAVGDVNIRVIGADNQIMESEIPVRQMLEQIIAKLGVPPYILGISWSSTERMSYQQADILTSEIEHYREILNPVIRKICNFYLRLKGCECETEIVWNNITLQDELQLAQARYHNAQAERIERETGGEKDA
ncbi:MAG: phage portal protein [Clostridia bacterium]|nr:phage portal protein [Clostridia bacterium]